MPDIENDGGSITDRKKMPKALDEKDFQSRDRKHEHVSDRKESWSVLV